MSQVKKERNGSHNETQAGDIEGAWGTIHQSDTAQRKNWKARLLTLFIIMGPGLVTMVGDNDAGAIATYTQAGQNYGTSLLWTLLLLIPVLIVNQEMVVRLGAVTGVGHARLIFARFGRFWGAFSVGDLFLLNFLIIVTEFIGFAMALQYFGIGPLLSVPLGVVGLIAVTVTGSFRRWEAAMWICALASLLMILLAFLPRPAPGPILHDTFVPSIRGGATSTALLTVIAIVGTTVAPWQLFFQQSNVIDKRITTRWMRNERFDTIIGAFLTNIEAAGLIIAAAFVFAHTKFDHAFVDTLASARAYTLLGHPVMGAILAIILLNASIIGACTVSLSLSYAFGDTFGIQHSLHSRPREAKVFYGSYAALVTLAGGIVLIPHAPLGLLTLAAQALAGILLPGATVLLVLLCNDRAVLGPRVNTLWSNALATLIVGLLVLLSLIQMTVTIFPTFDISWLTAPWVVAGAGCVLLGVLALLWWRSRGKQGSRSQKRRERWQMPPLEELPTPVRSVPRTIGLFILRVYLIFAIVLLVIKIVQLATGH